ncbi:MAG TPA: hypothetical protein PLP19_20745 [bacterium]|nr:hypothetical protein [bacterium]HPN45925.1 hypothetical protein [bacterium]
MSDVKSEQPAVNMGNWISKSWDLVFSDLGNFILITLLYVVINAVVSGTIIGIFLVAGPLTVGYFISIAKKIRGEKLEIGDLGKGFQYFAAAFLSSIVISIFVSIGFIFLIIPGIVISALYMFTPLFIIEQNLDFWSAMEASRKLAQPHIFELSVFMVLLFIISMIGVLLCGVGVLIATPICFTAVTLAYNALTGKNIAAV